MMFYDPTFGLIQEASTFINPAKGIVNISPENGTVLNIKLVYSSETQHLQILEKDGLKSPIKKFKISRGSATHLNFTFCTLIDGNTSTYFYSKWVSVKSLADLVSGKIGELEVNFVELISGEGFWSKTSNLSEIGYFQVKVVDTNRGVNLFSNVAVLKPFQVGGEDNDDGCHARLESVIGKKRLI